MGADQSQQRLDLCKDQLAQVRIMYNQNMDIVKQQLQAANDGVKAMRTSLLQMQKDGGATIEKTQQTILKIQELQGNISTKQKEYDLTDLKVRDLEKQCDTLENQIMNEKKDLDGCQSEQGVLPYNKEILASLSVVLITSLASGIITKQIVKK